MTSTEFEQRYADDSGVTVEQLREWDRVVVVCECDYEECQGWAILPKDIADFYINDMPCTYGHRYPLAEAK